MLVISVEGPKDRPVQLAHGLVVADSNATPGAPTAVERYFENDDAHTTTSLNE